MQNKKETMIKNRNISEYEMHQKTNISLDKITIFGLISSQSMSIRTVSLYSILEVLLWENPMSKKKNIKENLINAPDRHSMRPSKAASPGLSYWSCWVVGHKHPIEYSKYHRLLPKLLVTLHNLIAKSLMLKIPLINAIKHGEIELVLN